MRRIEHELVERADRSPSREAVRSPETTTYAELARRAGGVARRLVERGVKPGDRVAVLLSKSLEQVASLYGIWLAGGVAVPVHDVLRSRQIEHVLDHSGARVVLGRGKPLERAGLQALEGRAVLDPGQVPAAPIPDVAADGGRTPAAILYTSGSTGKPKGILLSHENLCAGARIVSSYLELREDDRILSVLPFAFDYGLNQLLSSVHVGSTLVLCSSTLPGHICQHLEEHRITALAGVPPLWAQLMGRLSPLPHRSVPDLRLITNSGGAFPVELLRRYRSTFPHVDVFLMYGLTEAFRSTYLPPSEVDVRPTSMGRAIPETEILIVDERGREVPPGQEGELVHRGPTVALGYWNDLAATQRVFRPDPRGLRGGHPSEHRGGHRDIVVFSGDRVRKDEDGYLYFAGRRDQLLKCRGHRVSPDEIEEVVHASGLVEQVAVCGEPDPIDGTRIVLHVVPRTPRPDLERRLKRFCRKELPRYMAPARIVVHDDLPRTASGKLDRKRLAA